MTRPTVCALCLTADRQALTDRCVRSFLAQDYKRKALLIYDTGKVPYQFPLEWCASKTRAVTLVRQDLRGEVVPIGRLRNLALGIVSKAAGPVALHLDTVWQSDIICHFDSDDYSAPTRISDQVKLLVESGKECVGYREMLVWKRDLADPSETVWCHCGEKYWRSGAPCPKCHEYPTGEAWLYTNTNPKYAMETSMCYWRSAWEKTPFDECMQGEAKTFMRTRDVLGGPADLEHPPMVACIHGSNTSCAINAAPDCHNPDGTPYWRRLPDHDVRLRELMESA